MDACRSVIRSSNVNGVIVAVCYCFRVQRYEFISTCANRLRIFIRIVYVFLIIAHKNSRPSQAGGSKHFVHSLNPNYDIMNLPLSPKRSGVFHLIPVRLHRRRACLCRRLLSRLGCPCERQTPSPRPPCAPRTRLAPAAVR